MAVSSGLFDDERRNWILAFFDGAPTEGVLDQIRVMKGMFLLSMDVRHPVHLDRMYSFEAYNWGPFDSKVYRDLDALQNEGLLSFDRRPGSSQIRYALTESGVKAARLFKEKQSPLSLAIIESVRDRVISKPFRQLLSDIYTEYPDYAVNSRLR